MTRDAADRRSERVMRVSLCTHEFDAEALPFDVAVVDEGLTVVAVNRVVPEVCPIHVGTALVDALAPSERTGVSQRLHELVRTQRGEAFLSWVESEAGRIAVELRVKPHRSAGREAGLLVTIAPRVPMPALETLALERSQRTESLGRLAAGMAHDFNNLLQVIQGSAELLRLRLGLESAAELQAITDAASRGAELTSQVLAFARTENLLIESADLNELVAHQVELLRRVLPASIRLVTRYAQLPRVRVDRARMDQVLANLCLNARDAMPEGGVLEIMTSVEPRGGDEPLVRLTVRDTGCGMGPEVRARVFEPFYTTKPAGQGTGLGLTVANSIIAKHGGHIEVESEPGQGTAFSIVLPAVHRAAPSTVAEAPELTTVLLADDNDAVRSVVRRMLETRGHHVIEAPDGRRAVELFEADPDAIGLVLLDAIMPLMGGQEAARAILAQRPNAQIMFLSGYSASELDQAFLRERGLTVISKPVSPQELLRLVDQVLTESRSANGREPQTNNE
jgi:signal transduction histidine kinase/CheY-like chemotaxis protein